MGYRNIFVLIIVVMLLNACCGEIRSPQVVNVSPLYELPVPLNIQAEDDLAELDIFDQITLYGYGYRGEWLGGDDSKHPGLYSVKVDLELLSDIQSANDIFIGECEHPSFNDQSRFTYEGNDENQYCVSYVQEYRYSIDAFCEPTGEYVSFVVFQKGNLVIRVWEDTRDKNSTAKDDVIELLAQELGQ
jgi:hypothetical protein